MIKAVWCNILKNKLKFTLLVLKLLTFIDSGCYGYKMLRTSQNTSITNNNQGLANETISTGMLNKHDVPKTQANKLIKIFNTTTKILQNSKRIIYSNETAYMNTTDHTDGRRSNNFEVPVDINDPNFQSLLNQYRGMVHKFNAPQNQHKVQGPLNNPSDDFPVPQDFAEAYLTTKFFYSTTPANPGYYGFNEPAFIRGRAPKWGAISAREGGQEAGPGDMITHGYPTTEPITRRPIPGHNYDLPPANNVPIPTGGFATQEHKQKFTARSTTTIVKRRTTPPRVSFEENCDYIAYYCLKAYVTGKVCGRTLENRYLTFENYCMMDFVNCMERYEVWQIAHMGMCFELKILEDYLHYPYLDDYFLDQYYIAEV